MRTRKAVKAGMAAFAVVFATGFVLGTIRVLAVAPYLGSLTAVAIEVPLMLIASWAVTSWAIERWGVDRRLSARIEMGAIAFMLLIAFEAMFGIAAFGQSSRQWLSSFFTPAGAVGLIAQLAFGFMPVMRMTFPHKTP